MKWIQPTGPLTDGLIKKMWYLNTTECYLAIQKNERLSLVPMWKISQAHNNKFYVIPLIVESENIYLIEVESIRVLGRVAAGAQGCKSIGEICLVFFCTT